MGDTAEARFSYHLVGGGVDSCPDPDLLTATIRSAFHSLRRPGCLILAIPRTRDSPPCADPDFRRFAQRLLTLAPGLPFFVFGGGVDISREAFLAQLPNLRAARDQHGRVVVAYLSHLSHSPSTVEPHAPFSLPERGFPFQAGPPIGLPPKF